MLKDAIAWAEAFFLLMAWLGVVSAFVIATIIFLIKAGVF